MRSASRENNLLAEAYVVRVNEEVEEEQQQEEEKEEKEGSASVDEDQMTISQYMTYRGNILDASHVVQEEMPSEAYERTEAKKKRPRYYVVEAENVGTETKRSRTSSQQIRELVDVYDGDLKVQTPLVMDRAKQVQANLNPEFPSFIKLMLRSHVSKGFWLGLPARFCEQHMPKHDETVVLVGENGEEYKANFLTNKSGLSGGWRGFSLAHELEEGDVVVFQLMRQTEFKVYIVRKNALADVDGALILLNLDANANGGNIDARSLKEEHRTCKKAEGNLYPKLVHDDALTETDTKIGVEKGQSDKSRENSLTESTARSNYARSFVDFQSFTITVNGYVIDSELSESLRVKYHELCWSQKSYLHDRLLKSINPRLAAGIILETLNMAEAIQACGLSTFQDDFAVWDMTLKGIELLGMDVGFLRARINQLLSLAAKSGETPEFEKYIKAQVRHTCLEKEIMKLETTLAALKHENNMLSSEIDTLKMDIQRYELTFEEEARAPW